jgi:hypothetical protein
MVYMVYRNTFSIYFVPQTNRLWKIWNVYIYKFILRIRHLKIHWIIGFCQQELNDIVLQLCLDATGMEALFSFPTSAYVEAVPQLMSLP